MDVIVGWAGFAVGAVGAVLAAVAFWDAVRSRRRLKTIAWEDLQKAARHLASKIKNEDFIPDLIIAPGPRGGIVAELVAQQFTMPPHILVGTTVRAKDADSWRTPITFVEFPSVKWSVFFPEQVTELCPGSKILLIDDYARTGESITLISDWLASCGNDNTNIKTATVAVSEIAIDNQRDPDHHWKRVDSSDFSFPWGAAK